MMADEAFHRIIVAFVLPISFIALFLGCRRHKDRTVSVLGIIGLILLALSAYFGHELFGELGEKVVTVISGLILAISHYRNYRLCQHDGCEA